MLTLEQLQTLVDKGGSVVNSSGEKIGNVGQIYLDDQSGSPSWVTVKTGLFGTAETFVPLNDATVQGDDVRVPYDKDTVKDAPRVDADGDISPEEESELYRYYGLESGGFGTSDDRSGYTDTDTTYSGTGTDTSYSGTGTGAGYDAGTSTAGVSGTSGTGTSDDAMTLSEEQLHVGTERRATGKARLRKYVVTENVTKTVPVTREEVRLEREPITDANRGDALSGPEISEDEHEVTLHEETPVVEKETVPVERVRLDKETVTEQETVTGQVRKEELDTDIDDERGGRGL